MFAAAISDAGRYRSVLLSKGLPLLLNVLVMLRVGNAITGEPDNLLLWLAYASEAICFIAMLLSFPPRAESTTLRSTLLAYVPCYFFLVFQLGNGVQLIPMSVGAAIVACGFCLQLAAKVTLGRRFGVLPAHRGIMTKGPYALVRHPIYLGYLLVHVGFLLSTFSLWNVGLLALVYTLLGLRTIEEEKVLGVDPEYRAYAQRVRFRVVPGIF